MNIALTIRHSLSGELKGQFLKILKILQNDNHQLYLTKNASRVVKNENEYSNLPVIKTFEEDKIDLLIFFGGDGTLLRTINKYAPSIFSSPIFGINAGNIGFFSSIHPDDKEQGLQKILSENYSKDERMVLQGDLYNEDNKLIKTFYALNECTIHHSGVARLREISTSVSGEFLTTYKSDGLIIATPTGSTAYNMAAGGPIVAVEIDAFILTPLAPAGFSQKPIVLPSRKEIEITADAPMQISIDGQEYFDFNENYTLKINQSKTPLTFLRLEEESYYKNIRNKLGWGG